MNYFLVLLIIGICHVLVAIPFVIYYNLSDKLFYSTTGCLMALLMGGLLISGAILFFYTFKFGAPATIAIPVYGIGALIIGAIGGILIFKEILTIKMIFGFIFGVLSIILLTIK